MRRKKVFFFSRQRRWFAVEEKTLFLSRFVCPIRCKFTYNDELVFKATCLPVVSLLFFINNFYFFHSVLSLFVCVCVCGHTYFKINYPPSPHLPHRTRRERKTNDVRWENNPRRLIYDLRKACQKFNLMKQNSNKKKFLKRKRKRRK